MTLPKKKPTPLLDLCNEGKRMANEVHPALMNDLKPPLIVLSDKMREEIRRILAEQVR